MYLYITPICMYVYLYVLLFGKFFLGVAAYEDISPEKPCWQHLPCSLETFKKLVWVGWGKNLLANCKDYEEVLFWWWLQLGDSRFYFAVTLVTEIPFTDSHIGFTCLYLYRISEYYLHPTSCREGLWSILTKPHWEWGRAKFFHWKLGRLLDGWRRGDPVEATTKQR